MKRLPSEITDQHVKEQRPITVSGRLGGVWTGLNRCVIQVQVEPDTVVEIGGAS